MSKNAKKTGKTKALTGEKVGVAKKVKSVATPMIAQAVAEEFLHDDKKTLDTVQLSDVSLHTSHAAADAAHSPDDAPASFKEHTVNVSITRKDKERKSSSVVYDIAGYSGKSVRFTRGLFPDKLGPASASITVPDGFFGAPSVPRAKMTAEERKAARAAAPKLTPAEKLAKVNERVAKLQATAAKLEAATAAASATTDAASV